MREQPSLFIKMSPVMAAKLTMCFGEQSWLDKSLRGRRCVWSTPIHLYSDLPLVGDPSLRLLTVNPNNTSEGKTVGRRSTAACAKKDGANRSYLQMWKKLNAKSY